MEDFSSLTVKFISRVYFEMKGIQNIKKIGAWGLAHINFNICEK